MKNVVEIEDLIFHHEMPTYYIVAIDEDSFRKEAERIFLNKEYVTKEGNTFIMPEWYAVNKGLV